MAEVLKIIASEAPSSYSNHVIVEETRAGSFRATGACNRKGLPEYFAPPQAKDLASILSVANAWADERGIRCVHLVLRAVH